MSEFNLSYAEVEETLESIITNRKLAQLRSLSGTQYIILCHPSSLEILQSRYIKKKALAEAKAEGLPTLEEMRQRIEQNHLKDPATEAKITELEDKIAAQKRLFQVTKIAGRRKPIQEVIERLETERDQLKNKDALLLYMTADKKAEEEAFLYLLWAAVHTLECNKFWNTFRDFENETDLVVRQSALEEFASFNAGLSVQTIRYLARHNLWRIRYSAALKLGGSLFSRDLNDLTPDQLSLLYWSNYYQSIYEMMPDDQPSDDVIRDDESLDRYMEDYFKQKERDRKEARTASRSSGKRNRLSPWDKGEELIITPAHPEYMQMAYSEERLKTAEGVSEIEAISPNSRRARNRATGRLRR